MAIAASSPLKAELSTLRRSSRNIKRELIDNSSPLKPLKPSPTPRKRIKTEHHSPKPESSPSKKTGSTPKAKPKDKAAALQSKKLSAYSFTRTSPFPNFPHPTAQECSLALSILSSLHGARSRPTTAPKASSTSAGCGASPSVLDALVRTILSQNTSDRNSSRAKLSMDAAYSRSDNWAAIVQGGRPKLEDAIRSGGLAAVKSRVIIDVLEQVHAKYGAYSLDHLFAEPDDAACMRELLSFKGIGPKTASCVLLFCLRRESFAVDTHVHRITGLLGWRPEGAGREEAHAHLDARIPDGDKYPLHVLLIAHGKKCEECKAGGKNLGRCELRKAFRRSKVKGEAGEVAKREELDVIKKEEEEG
ncbi:unnamed protein product [Clonostachys rhizophaga]|uniref:HhH-GPD domain-containing protein n=1 Tax=Clonostachys rhizophaga TaxID=160324 RepID=A0A9N9W2J7_9HYPO|nr:unnamed protein product [Clonostachys rhizophaga]